MRSFRSEVTNREHRVAGELMLKVQRPVLHVWRMPIVLHRTKILHGQVCCDATARIIEIGVCSSRSLLERRIESDVLEERSDEHLLVIDPVAGANRSLAVTSGIPRDAEA